MTNIEIQAKDIGGVEKTNATLKIGQMNIIEGSSSSGKSSLMRGIHLALVGRPPMEGGGRPRCVVTGNSSCTFRCRSEPRVRGKSRRPTTR